jgi:guanylate kinase
LEDFQKKIKWNDFFEYEEVFPSMFYGFSRKELERFKNKLPICAVDVNGALKFLGKRNGFIDLKNIEPIVFYIFAPHSQLVRRMEEDFKNGSRNDSEANLKKRIARIHYELEQEKHFDHPYVVDNSDGNFKNAVNQILKVLEKQI